MSLCFLALAPAFFKFSIVRTENPMRFPSGFLFCNWSGSDMDSVASW
jgi:hypothetical protein